MSNSRKSFERTESPVFSPSLKSPSSFSSLSNNRSQFPFTRNDSLQKTAARYPQRRRGSGASIASSIGGTLDTSTASAPETVNELAHNAIANLNSPPIVRTGLVAHASLATSSSYRAPSTRDIPPVTLTNIPHVEPSAFQAYLSQVGPLYEAFRRAKAASEDAAAVISPSGREGSVTEDEFSVAFGRKSRSGSQSSQAALSPLESPSLRRPSSSGGIPRRKSGNVPTPLSTIPNVYFDEDFHLENPRIFDIVSEKSDVIPQPHTVEDEANGSAKAPAARRKALHTNAILQEKLSWYMDTVEVHLISSIATASSSFFAALTSLKDLQSEAEECIVKIRGLRSALQNLDNDMAIGGLEIVNKNRRRANLQKLSQAVDQICDVVEQAKSCEDLVDKGSLEEASSRIDDLDCLIAGKAFSTSQSEKPRIDLRGIKALDGFSNGLTLMRARIGEAYESKFIDALLSDLRDHVKSVPAHETMQRWANSTYRNRPDHNRKLGNPAYMANNERLRPELLSALAGLSKAGHTGKAAAAYRESVMREVKSLIRRHLPSSTDDDAESMMSISTNTTARSSRKMSQQEKSAILARNLRALDESDAEELLIKIYTGVGEALRRLGTQVKVLLDVTSSFDASSKPTSTRNEAETQGSNGQVKDVYEEVTQALDLSSLLGQAVDTVYSQITKVLRVRTDQAAVLTSQKFIRYFILTRMFADECEAVTSRSGDALKEVINSQVKDFLQKFADSQRASINATLEQDRWEVKDFGAEDNQILSRVLGSMTGTPSSWTDYTLLWAPPSDHKAGTNGISATSNEDPADKARPAVVDEQHYFLVASALAALRGIEAFQKLMAGIPSATGEISNRFLEYLRFFNSRCQQLILGAGATRSAGLKNITTKHLALASQACSFLTALLPYLREFVRRQSPGSASALLPEFDKVKHTLLEHKMSIHDKLVEIMSQRCNAHAAAMKKLDFDTMEGDGPSAYIEGLGKETSMLYRVLGKHVPEPELAMIMTPIFTHYTTHWTAALKEVKITTEKGRARLLQDMEALSSRLAKLEGSAAFLDAVVKAAREKNLDSAAAATSASKESTEEKVTKESS